MKTLLTLLLLFVSGIVSAQNNGTVTLTIKLQNILSLTIAGAPPVLTFDSESKYENGSSVEIDNHIEVVSTKGYVVTVSTTGFTSNPSALSEASIKITASAGSYGGRFNGITSYPTITLSSTTPGDLITSTTNSFSGGTKTKFKVKYEGSGYFDNAEGDNTIPIVYTVTQP